MLALMVLSNAVQKALLSLDNCPNRYHAVHNDKPYEHMLDITCLQWHRDHIKVNAMHVTCTGMAAC